MRIIDAKANIESYMSQLMEIEQTYNPKLRESIEEKKGSYTLSGSIILLSLEGDIVLGERSGLALTDIIEEELIQKIPNFSGYASRKTLYVHSFTVRPEYRGNGIGKNMARSFIDMAKSMDYQSIIGHAREGASCHVNQQLGSRIIKPFENWYDTGETYYFHELNI